MSCAGGRACSEAHGPGSFIPAFLDNLWLLNGEMLTSGEVV
jgi:hydroxyethylthiazole kinase